MKSFLAAKFWQEHGKLSAEDQAAARTAFARFMEDPGHPSLRFGKLAGHADLWYARVTRSIRVVGERQGDEITWLWIGPHDAFDRRFGG